MGDTRIGSGAAPRGNERRASAPVVSTDTQARDRASPGDDTTLAFHGVMRIDDDAGGDPYNHTGRFRRVNR
jgi:hypothetical protein